MKNKKELIICLFTIIVLILTITNVFATSPSLNDMLNDQNDDGFTNIQGGNTASITNKVNTQNSILNTTNIVNKTNNNTIGNNTTLPQTGLDSSLTIMIVVCGASILYAYTRIRKSDI